MASETEQVFEHIMVSGRKLATQDERIGSTWQDRAERVVSKACFAKHRMDIVALVLVGHGCWIPSCLFLVLSSALRATTAPVASI